MGTDTKVGKKFHIGVDLASGHDGTAMDELIYKSECEDALTKEIELLGSTYYWRRGEVIFQVSGVISRIYEGKEHPYYKVDPGSAFRVAVNSIGTSGSLRRRFWFTPMDIYYIPVNECNKATEMMLEEYNKLSGI